MEQHKIFISEESLRNDDVFINNIIKELPNKKPSQDFTKNVMQKVLLQTPIKQEAWYQSFNLWLILSIIAFVFIGFFEVLYFLCDKSIALMFHVILKFIEKFETRIPDLGTIFQSFNISSTLVVVTLVVCFLIFIDFSLSLNKKQKKERLYFI